MTTDSDTSMTVRAALTVAASQEEEWWTLGRRLVERHRIVMQALERDEELARLRAVEKAAQAWLRADDIDYVGASPSGVRDDLRAALKDGDLQTALEAE